jgi:hypothetical protein
VRWLGLLLLAIAGVGVGVGIGIGLSSRSTARPTTVRATTYEVISGERRAGIRPAPLPAVLEGAVSPEDLVLSDAVPADATVDRAAYIDPTRSSWS